MLKETITNRLVVFGRKILRKIFGPTYENVFWRIKTDQQLDKPIQRKNIIKFARAQRLGWYGRVERILKQEWSKQYTHGNPFQRGQEEDQRYAGRMTLEKKYRGQKCQIGRSLFRIGEDERKWLRRPKLCTKICRAVLRRRSL